MDPHPLTPGHLPPLSQTPGEVHLQNPAATALQVLIYPLLGWGGSPNMSVEFLWVLGVEEVELESLGSC